MTHPFARPRYLLQWDHSCALSLGRDFVMAKHRLGELSLANDQQLISVLDRYSLGQIQSFTMGDNPAHPNQWQPLPLECRSGSQLLQQIRAGRLYVVLKDVANFIEGYGSLTSRLYEEIEECNPGFRSSAQAADLVLASPGSAQYFNVDHQPSMRWQLRGHQTVFSYPATSALVDDLAVEETVLDGGKAGLYYEPQFELSAQRHSFKSGQVLSIPHPTPYRSEFFGDVCVWIQTRHHTPQSVKRKNIAAANRVGSRLLPAVLTRPQQTGFIAAVKHVLSASMSLADRVSQPVIADTPCCCASLKPDARPKVKPSEQADEPAVGHTTNSRFAGIPSPLLQRDSLITGPLTGPNSSAFTTVVSEN